MNWHNVDLDWAYGDLLASIYRHTKSMDRAYDVLHDSLIRLAISYERTMIVQPHAYLRSVVRSVLADRGHDVSRWMPFPNDDVWDECREHPDIAASRKALAENTDFAGPVYSPEQAVYERERLQSLQRILESLPPRCREVFWMYRIEGMTQSDIAERLGISLRMVQYHIQRATVDLTADPAASIDHIREQTAKPGRPNRRHIIKGGVLGLLLSFGTGGLFYRRMLYRPLQRAAFQTAIGELNQQRLSDGSTLILGGDSKIRVAFSQAERQVSLLQGEVIFDVARDTSRPFIIDCGLARITVLGTRFAVARVAGKLRVSLDHGRVELANGPFWNRETLILHDGQVAEVEETPNRVLPPHRVDQAAGDGFAYQRGALVFHKASLTEIAETLSRYRRRPVQIGPGTPTMPFITAVARLSQLDEFIRLLPAIVPVRLVEEPHRSLLIKR